MGDLSCVVRPITAAYCGCMSAIVYAILLFTFAFTTPVLAESVPFDVCVESMTWVRPSPEEQAKVWNDPRYHSFARDTYSWSHDFIVMTDPQSTSAHGDFSKLSGLWTALPWQVADVLHYDNNAIAAWTATHEQTVDRCPTTPRSPYEWIEVWSLLHRVRQVQHDANTYTVVVEPVTAGFQMIYIRRLHPSAVLRFVTAQGVELERWDESAPPPSVKNTLPPGLVVQPLIVQPRK
jgi:hypothetical protein